MTYQLKLRGAVPSKKDRYRRVTVKGKKMLAIDGPVRAQLDSLQLQIQSLWHRPPLVHPMIEVFLKVSNPGSDVDGAFTSLLDLMQPQKVDGIETFGGVIKNDNVRWCNGMKIIYPAEVVPVGQEEVLIVLHEENRP